MLFLYSKRLHEQKNITTVNSSQIPNRIDIDERPSIVNARTCIGDWEVDLVIGKGHKGGFATLAQDSNILLAFH
jgi:IS30 family transposase